MSILSVVGGLTDLACHPQVVRDLLGQCLGYLYANPAEVDCYTALFPKTHQEGIERFTTVHIPYLVVLQGITPLACHWLHDLVPEWQAAWVGAFLLKPARRQRHLQRHMWSLTREAMVNDGFSHLFGATFLDNDASHNWVTQTWDFHQIGEVPDFLPSARDHALQPARLYAQDRADTDLAWAMVQRRLASRPHEPPDK